MNHFSGSDITEQYLNKFYEDLHKEQLSLMNSIKSSGDSDDKSKDKDITKQISLINGLMMGALRLQNVKKATIARLNSS
jgi:hypothetical protein